MDARMHGPGHGPGGPTAVRKEHNTTLRTLVLRTAGPVVGVRRVMVMHEITGS